MSLSLIDLSYKNLEILNTPHISHIYTHNKSRLYKVYQIASNETLYLFHYRIFIHYQSLICLTRTSTRHYMVICVK